MFDGEFTHADVLGLWTGTRYLSKAARDIGVPRERLRMWIRQGNVPPRYWPQLIEAVRDRFEIRLTEKQLTEAVVRAALAKEEARESAVEAA